MRKESSHGGEGGARNVAGKATPHGGVKTPPYGITKQGGRPGTSVFWKNRPYGQTEIGHLQFGFAISVSL